MAIKRKATTGSSTKLFASARKSNEDEVEEDAEVEEPKTTTMKRPAAAATVAKAELGDENEGEDATMEADEDEEDTVSAEQKLQQLEEEETARRRKELKGMAASEIKDLGVSNGLEAGNKADMIEAILAHEAKERADKREHEARLRAVVVEKKEELEAQSVSELSRLCAAIGVKGIMSKQERVEHLMKHWQENDGVDKSLAQKAYESRKQALEAMDKVVLKGLCEKAGVDPLVAEAMVDRISTREHEMGLYLRPSPLGEKCSETNDAEDADLVSALLQNEKSRKKERDLKSQQQEASAHKKKELKAMTVDELRKALEKKGAEPTGKKDDMVEALFAITAQEEAVIARKAELKALSVQELKDLCTSKRLEAGTKNEMVDALLFEESRLRESFRAFDDKVREVLAKKKEELEAKTNTELKELCASKGLKLGVGKEERVERLVEEHRRDGEADKVVSVMIRSERKNELSKIDKQGLFELCEKIGADPLVKEVMIERILAHESEAGASVDELEEAEPAAKKARGSKK